MRIKRKELQVNTLPIAGKIKIGEKIKSRSGFMIPTSLDYFKATGENSALFYKAFGEKPTSLTVVFTSDDDNFSCSEYYECRGKKDGSLWGRGDGKEYTFFNRSTQKYENVSREELLAIMQDLKSTGIDLIWKASVTILFLLPDIKGLLGVWELTTHGEASSIRKLVNSFDMVKGFAGTVLGVPFTLSVKKVKSQKPDVTSSFPVLSLVPNISQENVLKLQNMVSVGVQIGKLGILSDDKIEHLQVEYEVKNG